MKKETAPRVFDDVKREHEEWRLKLVDMVDEVHAAYRATGKTGNEYLQAQWFESLLFRAWRNERLNVVESIGALRVMCAFERALVRHYKEEKRLNDEQQKQAKRG